MNVNTYYTEYCSGCGLCQSAVNVGFEEKNGFEFPVITSDNQIDFCKKVCPVNAHLYNKDGWYNNI